MSYGKCGIIKQRRLVQPVGVIVKHSARHTFPLVQIPIDFTAPTLFFCFSFQSLLVFFFFLNVLIFYSSSMVLPTSLVTGVQTQLPLSIFFLLRFYKMDLLKFLESCFCLRNPKFALITVTWKGNHIGLLNILLCIGILIFHMIFLRETCLTQKGLDWSLQLLIYCVPV